MEPELTAINLGTENIPLGTKNRLVGELFAGDKTIQAILPFGFGLTTAALM